MPYGQNMDILNSNIADIARMRLQNQAQGDMWNQYGKPDMAATQAASAVPAFGIPQALQLSGMLQHLQAPMNAPMPTGFRGMPYPQQMNPGALQMAINQKKYTNPY